MTRVKMTSDTSTDLSNNQLSGAIPSSLGTISGVSVVRLSHNNLVGYVPDTLIEQPSLRELSLTDNFLAGFNSSVKLENVTCDISQNFLACPIESWVAEICGGVCGQVTVHPSMNITREIQRAVRYVICDMCQRCQTDTI